MFSCEYCENFKNTYFEWHLRTTASGRVFKSNPLPSPTKICISGQIKLKFGANAENCWRQHSFWIDFGIYLLARQMFITLTLLKQDLKSLFKISNVSIFLMGFGRSFSIFSMFWLSSFFFHTDGDNVYLHLW